MNALHGMTVHKSLPAGEQAGAIFWHDGEKYYVTKAELDRIKSLPTADEVREKVAAFQAFMAGKRKA